MHAAACCTACLRFSVRSFIFLVMHAYMSHTQYTVDHIVTITVNLATRCGLARQCHSIANV